MTRPKVPEEKRQRTAQACDTCKRRKQKCNGIRPCNTCSKRSLMCSYTPTSAEGGLQEMSGSPTKRRHIADDDQNVSMTEETLDTIAIPSAPAYASPVEEKPSAWEHRDVKDIDNSASQSHIELDKPKLSVELETKQKIAPNTELEARSRHSTISGPEEEARFYTSPRMLQDPTGRLLYVGDSASLSYLQLIRMYVDHLCGPSQFTLDPSRHKIMENTISLPPHIRPPHILPDRATANVLVESYFTNTHGLIELFNRQGFVDSVHACYSDPLTVDSSFLCLLYLVFAIGLVLATPIPGSREDATIKRLKSEQFDRAEAFFRSAKCLGDPVSGFEDADFWSVQALSLMSVYMLAVSKRNAAYAYYGMAVRSAFALGLHRSPETMVIFKSEDQAIRRNLWRSLFVLDRFLAASLGRPTAISEDDCSPNALDAPETTAGPGQPAATDSSVRSLDAAVRSCQIIGRILRKIYSKRKISTKVVQEFWDECRDWDSRIHTDLDWKRTASGSVSPARGIAILHVNLLYCHSVILFSRPFFLFLIFRDQKERTGSSSQSSTRYTSRMERFAEACVTTSTHTIELVQIAFNSHYLPQRNPFVLYFLFAASLILLSNEFAGLYRNPFYSRSMASAIAIVTYCSESDPQAARLLYILTSFRDVVASHRQMANDPSRSMSTLTASPGGTYDHMAGLFVPHESMHHIKPSRQSMVDPTRRNSLATISVSATITPTIPPGMPPPPGILAKSENGLGGTSGISPTTVRRQSMGGAITDHESVESSGEQEIDFDSIWDMGLDLQGGPGQAPVESSHLPLPGPSAGRYDSYAGYTVGQGPGTNMTPNVPLYTPGEY